MALKDASEDAKHFFFASAKTSPDLIRSAAAASGENFFARASARRSSSVRSEKRSLPGPGLASMPSLSRSRKDFAARRRDILHVRKADIGCRRRRRP